MAYGPPDAPFHVIGSRTFPVPADRAMLETLLSELEKAGNTFSEYVANAEAYWRAINRFRHPDWPDDRRAQFKAEIDRLLPIVERQPTLPLSIQNCLSRHGRSMLQMNDNLIANKDLLVELRELYREVSEALNETPLQEPAGPPASGSKTPEAPIEPPQRVTLDQAAAAAHKHKRTLERYKTKGTLPEPSFEGGGGKPDLYDWKVIRPWLEKEFGVILPERYFGH